MEKQNNKQQRHKGIYYYYYYLLCLLASSSLIIIKHHHQNSQMKRTGEEYNISDPSRSFRNLNNLEAIDHSIAYLPSKVDVLMRRYKYFPCTYLYTNPKTKFITFLTKYVPIVYGQSRYQLPH